MQAKSLNRPLRLHNPEFPQRAFPFIHLEALLLDKLGLRKLRIPTKPEGSMGRKTETPDTRVRVKHQRLFVDMPDPPSLVSYPLFIETSNHPQILCVVDAISTMPTGNDDKVTPRKLVMKDGISSEKVF